MDKKQSMKDNKIRVNMPDKYLRVLLRAELLYGADFLEWVTKNMGWLLKEYDKQFYVKQETKIKKKA